MTSQFDVKCFDVIDQSLVIRALKYVNFNCCVWVVDTLLLLRTLYSYFFFFLLSLLSHQNFTKFYRSTLETSGIDLKLYTMCRAVSIRATAYLFGNLTYNKRNREVQNFSHHVPSCVRDTQPPRVRCSNDKSIPFRLKHCSESRRCERSTRRLQRRHSFFS